MPQALASRSRYCGSVLASLNYGVYAVAYGEEKIAEGRTQSTNRRYRQNYRRQDSTRTLAAWIGDRGVCWTGRSGPLCKIPSQRNLTSSSSRQAVPPGTRIRKQRVCVRNRTAGDVPECKSEEASHPAALQRHP